MCEFVTRSLSMTRWEWTRRAKLRLALIPLGASTAGPKRVLMEFHEDSHVPPTRPLGQGLLKP
jgi:hypothetical protein